MNTNNIQKLQDKLIDLRNRKMSFLDEHQEAMDKMRAEKKRIHNEFDSQIIACRKKIEDNQDKNDNEDTSETEES